MGFTYQSNGFITKLYDEVINIKKQMFTLIFVALIIALLILLVNKVNTTKDNDSTAHTINHFKFDYSESISSGIIFQNRRIYLYDISNLYIDEYSLKEYLEKFDIENIQNYFDNIVVYKDGGSKLYSCDKCLSNIKVLFCNTLDDNNDVYIGSSNMKVNENMCK